MIRIEVIIPLALEGLFSYAVPEQLIGATPDFGTGCRVVVPFGGKRYYTGVVFSIDRDAEATTCKEVEQILDAVPILPAETLRQWEWMAYYYACPMGSILRDALPSGLLPESKTMLSLVENFVAEEALSEGEMYLLDTLGEKGTMTAEQLERIIGRRLTRPLLRLIELGAIRTEEALQPRYRPKLARYLRLSPEYQTDEGALSSLIEGLARAPQQAELLMTFLHELESTGQDYSGTLHRTALLEAVPKGDASLRALIEKGVLQQVLEPVSRLKQAQNLSSEFLAIADVTPLTHPVTLYYGRTAEDKEAYVLGQIAATLERGGQVLYLTPSVHSVPSAMGFMQRLAEVAGTNYYPYHTLIGEAVRVETFLRLAQLETPALVVGTRSAIYVPLSRLSLVIIDEEQEYLYKQQLVAPRYHARDVALWRAHQAGAKVLLATLTPSAEVLFHALRGKYQLLRPEESSLLSSPASQFVLPSIEAIDFKRLRQIREVEWGHTLTSYLLDEIRSTIARGKKVLLLQNRRGYAPYVTCDACQTRLLCPHCDVSLTYHRTRAALLCHYCGYVTALPEACPTCGATEVMTNVGQKPALRQVGYGIERVEEELKERLPAYEVLRIDSDTFSSQKKRMELLEQIESGSAEILLGTQLIRNQPIWEGIGLIAVVQLDAVLGVPDFRSEERAYQLLYQLRLRSRAPEKDCPRYLIQTNSTEQTFIQSLRTGDYDAFISDVLAEREATNFPPFTRLTHLWLRGKDERLLASVSLVLSQYLKALLPQERVTDPQIPSVARLEGYYLRQIVIRRPFQQPYREERAAFAAALQQLRLALPESKRLQIYFDVDPL